jgi:hypothetical protein
MELVLMTAVYSPAAERWLYEHTPVLSFPALFIFFCVLALILRYFFKRKD